MPDENIIPSNDQSQQQVSPPPVDVLPKKSNKSLAWFLGFVVLTLVIAVGTYLLFTSKSDIKSSSSETGISSSATATPTLIPTVTPTVKEIIFPVASAFCGTLEQTSIKDADYVALFKDSCDLSLFSKKMKISLN